MTKTNKLHAYLPLVITGYILFALLVVGVVLSTALPFGKLLFDSRAIHQNVAILLVALTIGALLPFFLGYVIGDGSVKSKSKLSHHFNGMLFGLLAYWIMVSLSSLISIPEGYFESNNVRSIVMNLIPSAGVAIITAFLATAHVLSSHAKRDVVEYKPFIITLVGLIVLLPVWSLVNNIAMGSVSWNSFVPFVSVALLGVVSYAMLGHTALKKQVRISWSAVSVSVAFLSIFVSMQIIHWFSIYLDVKPTMESQGIVGSIGWIVGIAIWAAYWLMQVKSLRKAKK